MNAEKETSCAPPSEATLLHHQESRKIFLCVCFSFPNLTKNETSLIALFELRARGQPSPAQKMKILPNALLKLHLRKCAEPPFASLSYQESVLKHAYDTVVLALENTRTLFRGLYNTRMGMGFARQSR